MFEADSQTLYDLAPCALLSTLPTGEIVRANQTFFDWLGVAPADVIGRVRFQSLLTMGSRIYYETHYAPLLQMQGFVSEIALEMIRANGRSCPVVASARQILNAEGVPAGHHVALFDSTHRRRYEQELLHARKRADEAARALEAADRYKNEFIAMLAHELRNPLGPIRTAVELQRRKDLASNVVNRTSEMMQRQVGQMVRLVEDLLDVTRIAQGKLQVQPVPIDLSSVLHHALEESQPRLTAARVELDVQLPQSPIYASADASRLIQVIGNILHNAVKFTPAEGRVRVVLERNGSQAQISISDTGIGIAPEKLESVFNLFMQAAPSTERRGGLGIGLTLAKTLIEEHGGRISVRSEGVGKGTEFVVELPALTDVPRTVTPSLNGSATHDAVTPRRVLVVDDNRDSADLMTMLLEMAGHEVQQAYDGRAALERAGSFRPEFVVLDIGLPGLNGYEVAERIRALGDPQPVLVALTGWGQEDDRRRSEEAGFDAHLVKPVDHDVLTELMTRLQRKTPNVN